MQILKEFREEYEQTDKELSALRKIFTDPRDLKFCDEMRESAVKRYNEK